ncbi:hypothetical protein JW988_03455 [Candidatus Bathyarchaeota archaeon]|nr:hypothetical protein [Candidatus Bathyarchaeota archaeon]
MRDSTKRAAVVGTRFREAIEELAINIDKCLETMVNDYVAAYESEFKSKPIIFTKHNVYDENLLALFERLLAIRMERILHM